MNEFFMNLITKKSASTHVFLSCCNLLFFSLIALLDYFVPSIDLFIFYALVVVFAALFLSTFEGIVFSTITSIWSFLTNMKYLTYDSMGILYFNMLLDFLAFVLMVLFIVQLKKAFFKEKNLARVDYLTGLGNRRSLIEKLSEKNNEFTKEYSVCYIDIDNFYSFIEDFGLMISDQMIKRIALFLKKYYKEIYRYEENRFIIIIDEKEGGKTAFSKMNILKNELQMELFKQKTPVTISVGIVLVSQKGLKISTIITALFKLVQGIKKEGGNQVKYTILKP
jgi:diguanylate cyclase (GGDEF)-like protein